MPSALPHHDTAEGPQRPTKAKRHGSLVFFLAILFIVNFASAAQPTLAIENVTLLPMTSDRVQEAMTVVVTGSEITDIVPAGQADFPEETPRLNGAGKFLMPSLTDMHVHVIAQPIPELPYTKEDQLSPYLANGVLRVLDLGSSGDTLRLKARLAAGQLQGPALLTAKMVDGDPPLRSEATPKVVTSPAQAQKAVREIKQAGYNFIKVYSKLDIASYHALLAEAEKQNIRVVGHLPGRREAPLEQALMPGMSLVAHAEEFAFHADDHSDEAIARYVKVAKETGTALIPTLYLDEQILAQIRDPDSLNRTPGLAQVNPVELPMWFEANPYLQDTSPERIAAIGKVVEFNRRLVKAFADADIPLLSGTDTFIPGLAPGYALHEEFKALSRAGLTNEQILESATRAPAAWLGLEDSGTVEVGKRADLLLLSANPYETIENTKAISAVIQGGNVSSRAELDKKMADLDALYRPLRASFSPQAAEILGR